MKRNSLYWKGIAIIVIVLFIGMGINPLSATLSTEVAHISISNRDTLYVGGSGPNNYTKIQDAINNSTDGDTVFVYNGTYYENVVLNKSINLIGEDRNTTIIDGNFKKDVIEVIAHNVTIHEFTIQRCSWNAGIDLRSNHSKIYGNIIKDNHNSGILIEEASHNIIQGNIITNSTLNGMGIRIDYGFYNQIIGNKITFNKLKGIELMNSKHNVISNNTISNNLQDAGISLCVSYKNTIIGNTISNNPLGLRLGYEAGKTKIYHNNFINNSKHAEDDGDFWDNGYPSGGNYWDDYDGEDHFYGENQNLTGSDGIGDEPYQIYDEDFTDRYPFMEPSGWDKNYPPLVDLFIGPSYGKPGIRYSFMAGFYDPDWDCFYIKFDWGDGSFSDWLGSYGNGCWVDVPHAWSKGGYNIRVKAKDLHGAESNWSEPIKLRIESEPPTVEIIKPDKALYILNKKIIPRFLRQSLIIGNIDVTVDANDFTGIDKVEFYIDNKLKSVDNSSPYSYTWTRDRLQFIHLHVLKVIAYDYCGNMASDKIIVRRFL